MSSPIEARYGEVLTIRMSGCQAGDGQLQLLSRTSRAQTVVTMLTSTIFGLVGLLAHVASAKTVTYNWDITWVWASPDGHGRPVIGINGKWPCPPIEVNTGDRVVIHTTNRLQNETTSIHFHGLFQKGSNAMDGPAAVTQCPIPPGGTITYDFQVVCMLTFVKSELLTDDTLARSGRHVLVPFA
jgi:hypothetical protein